jgi:hypothetical protein
MWELVSGAEILSDKPNEIRCDFMIANEVRIPQGEENIIYHMLDYSLSLALTRWINYKQEKSTMSSSIVFHNKGDNSPWLAFL